MIKKKKKALFIIIPGAVLLLAAVIAIIVSVVSSSKEKRIVEGLELADRYLQEMEYEKAIAKYKEVIDIDPSVREAYEGVANSYYAWAEALYAKGDGTAAIETLEKGTEDLRQLQAADELIVRLTERIASIRAELQKAEEEPEPTPEPTPTPEPEPEYRICEIDLSSYDSYGYAFGGVLPVKKEDKWGAIDYSGKSIVPCEYTSFQSPNNAGYFILWDDEESVLFDKNGKEVVRTDGNIAATSEGYVIGNTDGTKVSWDFYRYDGEHITTLEADLLYEDFVYSSEMSRPNGFYEGKALFFGNFGEWVYDRVDYSRYTPFDYGLVSTDGSVEWIDGNGVDESDRTRYMTRAEHEAELEARRAAAADSGVHGSAGEGGGGWYIPTNPMNHGYFLTYLPQVMMDYYLRDENGIVASLAYGMRISGDELQYSSWQGEEEGQKYTCYTGAANNDPNASVDFDSGLDYYYYDGQYFMNYGSKMVFKSNEKYALIDLAGGKLEYKIFDDFLFSNEEKWAFCLDDKWGYCDHDGNVLALYDDVTGFVNGYGLIRDGERILLIDEELKEVEELERSSTKKVWSGGELFCIWDDEDLRYFFVETDRD